VSSLHGVRRDYHREPLEPATLGDDPVAALGHWVDVALASDALEPTAMTLATAAADGAPNARIVLLKEVRAEGLVFFTDHRSQKGQELAGDPRAAAVLHWPLLERQIRVGGRVHRLAEAESFAYFRTRPLGARHGAWASVQSQVLADRDALERALRAVRERFPGDDIPLPPHWGGYCLVPERIEFWQGRPDRLHDRFLFTRTPEHGWQRVRLSP
jgi:pyridoxamine 5'-phosphate oxidase